MCLTLNFFNLFTPFLIELTLTFLGGIDPEHLLGGFYPENLWHFFCQFSSPGLISPWLDTFFRLSNNIFILLRVLFSEGVTQIHCIKNNLEFLRNTSTSFKTVFWEIPLKRNFPFLFQRSVYPVILFFPTFCCVYHTFLTTARFLQEPLFLFLLLIHIFHTCFTGAPRLEWFGPWLWSRSGQSCKIRILPPTHTSHRALRWGPIHLSNSKMVLFDWYSHKILWKRESQGWTSAFSVNNRVWSRARRRSSCSWGSWWGASGTPRRPCCQSYWTALLQAPGVKSFPQCTTYTSPWEKGLNQLTSTQYFFFS